MSTTRFEQVGLVFDFDSQNKVIASAIAIFFLGIVAVMVRYGSSPMRSETTGRAYSIRLVEVIGSLALLSVTLFGFIAGKAYQWEIFPQPTVTKQKIIAESAFTIARNEIRNYYGNDATMDSDTKLSSDSAEARNADPRVYQIRFTATGDAGPRSCRGKLIINEPVSSVATTAERVDIDARISRPLELYAPVIFEAQCEG